jgi:trk system potassium uptake protein TrkH
MLVGASSGSTSGGIKSIRLIIIFKIVHRELMRLIQPRAVIHVHVGGKPVGADHLLNAVAVTTLFVACASLAFLLLMFMGVEPQTAGSATFATLSVTGPGLGEVGPSGNYAHLPVLGKWVLMVCMLLGRLEMFSVLLLFLPMTWKK